MFVRWKRVRRKDDWCHDMVPGADPSKRESYRYWREERWLRVAVLVESRRVEGKPRQRTRYLCSIREGQEGAPLAASRLWNHLGRKLATLDLPAGEQAKVIASVEEVVPRPDAEIVAREQAKIDAMLRSIARM